MDIRRRTQVKPSLYIFRFSLLLYFVPMIERTKIVLVEDDDDDRRTKGRKRLHFAFRYCVLSYVRNPCRCHYVNTTQYNTIQRTTEEKRAAQTQAHITTQHNKQEKTKSKSSKTKTNKSSF
jgi:hypothetical protein